MKWLLLISFFICANVEASSIALCEADGTFKGFIPSANTPLYTSNPHNLINQDYSACDGVPKRHCECIDTDADTIMDSVQEMSAADKLAVDVAIDTAKETRIRADAVAQSNTDRIIRALAICMGQFLNETRSDPNTVKPNITKAQGIQCIKDRINDGSAN